MTPTTSAGIHKGNQRQRVNTNVAKPDALMIGNAGDRLQSDWHGCSWHALKTMHLHCACIAFARIASATLPIPGGQGIFLRYR